MPMPKGHTSEHGYSTNKSFEGGEDYRAIAEKMTATGFKMNHATARNVFLSAMYKIARPVYEINGVPATEDRIKRSVKDPRFQAGIAEILTNTRVL